MRISDWSSDVCSSDLYTIPAPRGSRAGCAPAQVEKWGRARRAGSKKWAARGGPSWKGGSEGRGGGGNAAARAVRLTPARPRRFPDVGYFHCLHRFVEDPDFPPNSAPAPPGAVPLPRIQSRPLSAQPRRAATRQRKRRGGQEEV